MSILFRKLPFGLLTIVFAMMSVALISGQWGGIKSIFEFYGVSADGTLATIRIVTAIVFIIVAVLSALSLYTCRLIKPLAGIVIVISIIPLLSLLGSTHWIASLSGFPAIGSGQGIIKYFALMAIAVTWLCRDKLSPRVLIWINYFPIGLVLLWIGGMKFTTIEAEGIEGLVRSSPLMSWLYSFFSVQMASNLIGIYDLIALVIFALGLYIRQLLWVGLLLCAAVFLTTQTFLLSYPQSWAAPWQLSSSGIFIIKDLWFIVNLINIMDLKQNRVKYSRTNKALG
ncbi:YkgB family protein [Microbulbifer sp. OS29]|uniref:YkgB family protein n=1 Tax=Microbulbifer okhotskensis TaxID=2926617 RepID=A0A9X2J5T7_9GAMM|nr:DUF417 family protein [Microbulbifer okhotskensis]MCO1334739.1 YkgB family protein [Microbulbifer okhotskensis]